MATAFDPDTHNSATRKFTLGGEYRQKGKTYRYVRFREVDVVAAVAGTPVQWTATAGDVTADVSASVYGAAGPICGVALLTMTDDYYGFMQTHGHSTNVQSDGSVTVGMQLVSVSDGLADGLADISASLFPSFGLALATDSGSTVPKAQLYCSA